MLDMKLYWFCK